MLNLTGMRSKLFWFFIFLTLAGPGLAQLEDNGLGLAESLLQQNRFEDAEALAVRALEAEPESLRARFILARVCLSRAELERAQGYVDTLLSAAPAVPDHHALQGMIHMFAGRDSAAEAAVRKALELGREGATPAQMASYSNTLVLVLYKKGAAAEALELCREAITSYPQDPDLYLSCSRLYREAGEFQNALEIARQGLEVDPDFAGLYAASALAYAGLGQSELSEQAYQEALKSNPDLAAALRATLDGERPDEAEYKLRNQ